ncbi:MAG: glucose-6-phosphate dehydrogenase assembly protein OpcA [Verrucomicrobiales bacterium]|nr:glucose-6-phosphate dehydrogenase assembly protein OpcA [Verrucomicrobiales bacterium]
MPPVPETAAELGLEVPLAHVERELKALFSSEAAVTRASLMNFAIYSEEIGSLEQSTELIRTVTREHACRTLLIAVQRTAPELRVRSWVTAHCNVASNGGKRVCSEQITFLVEGGGPYLVPNMVFSRLDSDLPLVFWWRGPFSENFDFTLYSRIDRLMIDSSTWAAPLAEFERLEAAFREPATRFAVLDLTWTRLLPLRLALAACYDDPAALAELPRVNRVELRHGATHCLAARMLVAWMAHQAGWTWRDPGGGAGEFRFESREGLEVNIRLEVSESDQPVESLCVQGPAGFCRVEQEPGGQFLRSIVSYGPSRSDHLIPAGARTLSELVIERLSRGCNNRTYFSMLNTVRLMLQTVGS